MAELFRHLLIGERAPSNLFASATRRLNGESEKAQTEKRLTEKRLHNFTYQLRDRLNEDRVQPLEKLEELGNYLVFTARALNVGDLVPNRRPHPEIRGTLPPRR
jgi:hypothetical protein